MRCRRLITGASLSAAVAAWLVLPASAASAAAPSISVTPNPAISAEPVVVTGAGWPGYDTVQISLVSGASSTFMCNVGADSTGTIAAQSCSVPSGLTQGKYTLSASDGTHTATRPLTVNPHAVVSGFTGQPAPAVAAGQAVGLAGTGFKAGLGIKATFNGVAAPLTPPATTNSSGQFSGSTFVIPAATAAGTYMVVVKDSAGHAGSVALKVYAAKVTVAPSPGVSGSPVTLSGTGWPSHDSVRIDIFQGTTDNFMCIAPADGNGNLLQSCVVPTGLVQGKYRLVADDSSLAVGQSFTINPGVTVLGFGGQAAPAVAAGQAVGLAGSGFGAISAIKATFNGVAARLTPPATTNSSGQFSGSTFVVPAATAAGSYPLVVKDAAGHKATLQVAVYAATLTVAPNSGVSGRPVLLTGSGWPALDSVRIDLFQGTTENFMCSVPADSGGNISQSCVVPSTLVRGPYRLVAEDNSLAVAQSFTIKPGVLVTGTNGLPLASGKPGTSAMLSGSGFASGSTIVKVTIGTHTIVFTPKPVTDANGTFSGAGFKIPSIPAGVYTITVKDASGGTGTAQFKVT